ncbi:MAG: DUF255 domain-containing protein [Candidatus Kapaibacterium sp.]|nr:DUF255 domain-containing protein [Bacteroidota bacterium]
MKTIFNVLAVFVFIFYTVSSFAYEKGPSVSWFNAKDGLKEMATQHRPAIIDVGASWCVWCKRMDTYTYTDSAIIGKIESRLIPIRITTDEDDMKTVIRYKGQDITIEEFVEKFKIEGYPSTIFLNEDGEVLGVNDGYMNVEKLNNYLVYFELPVRPDMKIDEYVLREQLKLNPNDINLNYSLAKLLSNKQHFEEAIQLFDKVLLSDELEQSDILQIQFRKGVLLLQYKKDYQKAYTCFDKMGTQSDTKLVKAVSSFFKAVALVKQSKTEFAKAQLKIYGKNMKALNKTTVEFIELIEPYYNVQQEAQEIETLIQSMKIA